MRKEVSLEERQKIKDSLKATHERRKTQIMKVFELKVNCHHTSKETFKKMDDYFVQSKWVYNDMLRTSENGENIFKYEYNHHKEITRLDKDKNEIKETVTLPCVYHRGIVKQVKTNICNLSKAKNKGIKIGKLKYTSEINSIPIITGFIKIKDKKHITIPNFKDLNVYGLEQFINIPNYEIADGRLIKKASSYYVKITVCINKENSKYERTFKEVGLDFGIKDNITTSDGEKFNCNVQESEQLKFLQKQLHRKQKGSKRYYRLLNQIRREYEHLSNKKTEESNKLISYLKKNYDMIYFQDEMIAKWSKKKHSKKNGIKSGFSFGKTVQHSYLGRVKSKLASLEKDGKSFKISKSLPTTKFCPNCGCLNTLTLADRIYICECGYKEDRDVHASKNVKLFGSTKRAEWLEQPSVEELVNTSLNASRSDCKSVC